MNTLQRIKSLLNERNWTEYRLAKECGLSQSTISNIFLRNTNPSIPTLETICKAFGITMAQFFAEDSEAVFLTKEQLAFFEKWRYLPSKQKEVITSLIELF